MTDAPQSTAKPKVAAHGERSSFEGKSTDTVAADPVKATKRELEDAGKAESNAFLKQFEGRIQRALAIYGELGKPLQILSDLSSYKSSGLERQEIRSDIDAQYEALRRGLQLITDALISRLSSERTARRMDYASLPAIDSSLTVSESLLLLGASRLALHEWKISEDSRMDWSIKCREYHLAIKDAFRKIRKELNCTN